MSTTPTAARPQARADLLPVVVRWFMPVLSRAFLFQVS